MVKSQMVKLLSFGILILILILSPSLGFDFEEPFSVELANITNCKNNLGLLAEQDVFKLTLPKGVSCSDVAAALKVNGKSCWKASGDKFNKKYIVNNESYICYVSFKKLYELYCKEANVGEPYNKNWNIKFGYDKIGGTYIYNKNFKVLALDDIEDKCNQAKSKKWQLWISVPITIVGFIMDFFGFKIRNKKNKKMRKLKDKLIAIGLVLTGLGIISSIIILFI